MCRLLAVRSEIAFGSSGHLQNFARIAKESPEFQGHGWGCAWLDPQEAWQFYHNVRPVWEKDFSAFPATTLLVAHARSAFEDRDIRVENNMPFNDGRTVFIFNGELRGVKIREQGRIGAEKIFNFIRRFDRGDTQAALQKGVTIIRNRTHSIRGMNIIMVKDRRIYLSSLFFGDPDYFTLHYKEGPELVICSAPYTGENGWQSIPNETIRCL